MTVDKVKAAAKRLRGIAYMTPMLSHPLLDEATKGRVFIKAEPLQRTGSFKIRGAYNRLSQLTNLERKAGVVAFSSGNHAQGVACAAQLLGIRAAIVMPQDAPAIKVANTKSYGAEIIFYDRARESREEIAARLARERGAVLVPSYNDPHIIVGQGTVGLEMTAFAQQNGLSFDDVVVCLGGGGLISGISLAVRDAFPECRIWGVEPEGYDDAARSLEKGEIVALEAFPPTLCDALQTPALGPLTFALIQEHVSGVKVVSDGEVRRAVRFAFEHLKVVVEPGGAAALAAALAGKIDLKNKTAALVLSGGNVDPDLYAQIIKGAEN